MSDTKDYKRYCVTSALPYANGPIHIGHLAGAYIPADIYVRYLRLKGRDVKFICGSDEHGVAITIKARKEGKSPKEIVDQFHELNKKSFEDFGIAFDNYSRTSEKVHHETAQEIFTALYEKGALEEQTTEQFYDPKEQQFLADRYITGECPHCGNDSAYGDQCESCGTSLSPTELKNPRSALSGEKPELRKTTHWYLPLDKYEDWLKKWILEEHTDWKPNVYGQCKSWIVDQGLRPRAISRDLDWGVAVPLKDAEGKVLYVWFDAPIGYISSTKELTQDWEKYWKDKDTRLVHFIGKDNIVFHCIIFPSILKTEGSYILPDAVPANEFLNLEGEKISTSRNWGVWLQDYLEDFPGKQDVLRYVLTANAPETKDNDFTWKDFQDRNNNELVAILGNFVNRAIVLTHKYFDGKVPQAGKLSDYDRSFLSEIKASQEAVERNIEQFKFREALKDYMSLARAGNKYLAETEPWKLIKTDGEKVKTILCVSMQIAAGLAITGEPFLPNTAEKLRSFLNMDETNWAMAGQEVILPAGHAISKAGLLFEKVEDEIIQLQLDKLKKRAEEARSENQQMAPAKADIGFEDFQKLDIRCGTILEAEKVPKTKKLLKLKVDTGIDQRTVVSGIAEYYKADEIIGKQVSILVNLAPKKIKGIESQGMILMAENEKGELAFISPEKAMSKGAEIR